MHLLGGPGAQAQALQKFRSAFSHLENDDVTIAAWLTPRQWEALGAYRSAFGAAPKQHWALEELPVDTTDAEREQVGEFKARLEAEGKLVSKEDAAYASDLRLLQYLRAREHVLGAHAAAPACMRLHVHKTARMHVRGNALRRMEKNSSAPSARLPMLDYSPCFAVASRQVVCNVPAHPGLAPHAQAMGAGERHQPDQQNLL